MEFKRKVAESFGQAARHYDEHALMQEEASKFLANLMAKELKLNTCTALEIGAGTGLLTNHVLKHYGNAKWTLNDIAPQMLEKLASNLQGRHKVEYWQADAEAIVFKKDQYDLICASTVFQWMENLESFLARIGGASKAVAFNLLIASPIPQLEKVTNKLPRVCEAYDVVHQSFPDHSLTIVPQKITLSFKSGAEFLRNMKHIGAHTCKEPKVYRDLLQFVRSFRGQFTVEHEILHVIAVKRV